MAKMIGTGAAEDGADCAFFPEYEPAIRGGASFATIVTSDTEVESCVLSSFDYMAVMDNRTFQQQVHRLKPNGTLLYNSSLIKEEPSRTDIKVIKIPMNDKAIEMGNDKLANVIMTGAIWMVTEMTSKEALVSQIKESFKDRASLAELNLRAFEAGAEIARQQLS